jgi:hypothetical protein
MVAEISSRKHHDLVFANDTLRKECDIRNLPESKLTWYQKMQRRHIKKYTEDLEAIELGIQIRMIFDYWESEPSFPMQGFPKPLLNQFVDQLINQSINDHHHDPDSSNAETVFL